MKAKKSKKKTRKKTHRVTNSQKAAQQLGQPGISMFRLNQLQAAKYNPRVIDSAALKGLTDSISRFGCVEPIVINTRGRKNVIIGGHQRYRALRKLKVKECICVTVDCSKDDEKLLNITLNNPLVQGQFVRDISGYIDKLRKKIDDEEAFLDLRIAQLQQEIDQGGKKFEFRPGAANLKAKGGEKTFWLSKSALKRFANYKNFILDFSGGRDSTLALAWAVHHFSDRKIYPVYSDVGVEFPGMGAHVKKVCDFFGVECVIKKPEAEWWSWLKEKKKWPSLIFRPCQGVFIFSVTAAFRKQFDPKETLLLDGSRGTQAVRGSKKTKNSEVGSCPGYDAYHPCFDLTDEAAESLLKKIKPPLWDGYKKGFVRTACWCCPGQNTQQAYALQQHYPGLANCIREWEKIIGPIRPLEKKYFDDLVRGAEKKLKKAKAKG